MSPTRSDQNDDPTAPGSSHPVTRRAFLSTTATTMAVAAGSALGATNQVESVTASEDPTRRPGTPASPYGHRASFERAARLAAGTRSRTPLRELHGIVTPSALHFERHHNGVPSIDPARHRLLVHGLVHQPIAFTMSDLVRFPSVSRFLFIECSGNSGSEWQRAGRTVQEIHGLTSTSEWTGVALSTILREASVTPEAQWMLAEGSDAAVMTRSLPLKDVMDQALLCYAQNGEALRPEQGYPLRLIIPGWEGNACIKWLRRLKLGTMPFMTREETSHYTDLMPDGTARQFTFVMEAKSVITSPSGGERLQPGFVEIRGLAWSGRGRVVRVDISTDGGAIWSVAQLQEPILPKCHTRFTFPWRWNGREAIVQSRCTDETGYVQPTRAALLSARGVNSVYHYHAIQSWHLAKDGTVNNIHV